MHSGPRAGSPPLREAALLLNCARLVLLPGHEEQIRSLVRQGIDWDALLRITRRHGMVPLLHRHLRGHGDIVPAEPLATLRTETLLNAARSMTLLSELQEILQLFEEHGIAALPYKGPVLALQLYGEPAFRQMADLDIMVRREDAARAVELLFERGYRSPHAPSPKQNRALFRADNNYPLLGGSNRPPVEIHWAFAHRHPIEALDLDELRLGSLVLERTGQRVRTFAPEELLIVLCFHGGRHMWERLSWLCDVAELIRARPIDWDHAFARAGRFGSRRVLLLGLASVQRLLGVPLPEQAAVRVQADREAVELAEQVHARFFSGDERPSDSLGLPFHRFQMRAMDDVRSRVRYVARSLFIPTAEDWESIRLPERLFPLYHLVRPLRLAVRYGVRLSRSRRSREERGTARSTR
jgi:hypothetical protein